MDKISVLIVDDHELIRYGIGKSLSFEPRIEIVGEASDGQEAIEIIHTLDVDVILMDISMPRVNGITACKIIKNEKPDIKIIALTIHDHEEYIIELIKAGISGYVLKDVGHEYLIKRIIGVVNGESYLPLSLSAKVVEKITSPPQDPEHLLSERELEVLHELTLGKTNKDIAKKLGISNSTVKNHMTRIFQKLNVTDRTQAALIAVKGKTLS